MEYDQAETAEFAEKKGRWFSIGRWALTLFLFGSVCAVSTYWVLTMPDVIFSGKNQAICDSQVSTLLAVNGLASFQMPCGRNEATEKAWKQE